MPQFTHSKPVLPFSLLGAALSCVLLAPPAYGQILNGGPSQLRPQSGSAPVNLAPPAPGGQNPQVRTDNRKVPVGVAVVEGELPTTDFGRQLLNTDHQLPVKLGVRTVPASGPAGASGGMPGMSFPHMPDLSGMGKAPDAPPSIRVSGGQAGDFLVTPAQCGFAMTGNALNQVKGAFTCTVVFRATVEGPRTALLEAMFANGDRLQAVLKGTGQPTVTAMPTPGSATGTGLQAPTGNKPAAGNAMVPETVDFGFVAQGSRKTLRVATKYPAGTRVLSHFGGAKIHVDKGFDTFTLGETAVSLNGAASGEKASFTVTYTPSIYSNQDAGDFTFNDADGRQRRLDLRGTTAYK